MIKIYHILKYLLNEIFYIKYIKYNLIFNEIRDT